MRQVAGAAQPQPVRLTSAPLDLPGVGQVLQTRRPLLIAGDQKTGTGSIGPQEVSWNARTEDPGGKTSPEELMAAADKAMYGVKDSGKNGIQAARAPADN